MVAQRAVAAAVESLRGCGRNAIGLAGGRVGGTQARACIAMVAEIASDKASMTCGFAPSISPSIAQIIADRFDGANVASDLHSRDQTTCNFCEDSEFKC